MGSKVLIFLTVLLLLGQQSLAKDSHSDSDSEEDNKLTFRRCQVSPKHRRDCGYPGISASECAQRKCCFDSRIPEVNWCFFSRAQGRSQCSVSPKGRKDCGFPGISAKDCYSRGCCYDSSIPETVWCFYGYK